MKKLKVLASLILLMGIAGYSYGQVAINTDGAQPVNSAMLEIASTNKGLLIPRMTTAQRTAIASPATGLLVFDSSLGRFHYYSGTAWVDLSGVYVSSAGLVGIGTSSPNGALEVRKDQAGSITQLILTNRGFTASGTGSALVFRGYRDTDQNYEVGKIEMKHKGGAYGDLTHAADMLFYTRNNSFGSSTPGEQMRITSDGNVGIGTTTPTQAKVVINGYANTSITGFGYLNRNGAGATNSTFNYPYSLYASNKIAAEEFAATSDSRIKRIIGLSNASADLKTLMAIRITDYCFRDTISKGTSIKKKVIAQEVKAVFPQAVSTNTDVVPDIYKKAVIKAGWVQLPTDLKPGEKVQLISNTEKQVYTVLEATKKAFRTNYTGNEQEVFVYGRQVNDFHNVDYEAIAMLNVSATQELFRLLEKQQEVIKAQKQQLETLETQLKKVDALEAAVKHLQNQSCHSTEARILPAVSK